jgi:hypothetical protein
MPASTRRPRDETGGSLERWRPARPPPSPHCTFDVRADVIRQFHERPDGGGMTEVLIDLEADELLRLQAIDVLRHSLGDGPE